MLETRPSRNPFVRAALAVEDAAALDPVVRLVEPLASALVSDPRRRVALQGQWLGHSLHPLLITVPIGAWSSVSVLDLLGGAESRRAARLLTGLGLLVAVPSAVTGMAEWAQTTTRDRRTATVHAGANAVALGGYALSWRARRQGRHARGAVLAAAAHTMLGVGGFLGGHLTEARKVSSRHPAFSA